MEEEIYIEDESGDKKYFTMLPNYILNHSTAIDQALYCQLKKFAGENGVAYPSAVTLMKKLGVTRNTIKKSIAYLIKRGWIKENGKKEIITNGGKQFVTAYKIIDIWKININHYEKDCQNNIDLNKGVSKGGVKGGCQNNTPIENHLEEEPSNREVANATNSPKNETIRFFSMVKSNGIEFADYLSRFNGHSEEAKKEIIKFYAYWTEPNSTGKKVRWEMEKTFEIRRRLGTWFSKVKGFNNQISNKYQAGKI